MANSGLLDFVDDMINELDEEIQHDQSTLNTQRNPLLINGYIREMHKNIPEGICAVCRAYLYPNDKLNIYLVFSAPFCKYLRKINLLTQREIRIKRDFLTDTKSHCIALSVNTKNIKLFHKETNPEQTVIFQVSNSTYSANKHYAYCTESNNLYELPTEQLSDAQELFNCTYSHKYGLLVNGGLVSTQSVCSQFTGLLLTNDNHKLYELTKYPKMLVPCYRHSSTLIHHNKMEYLINCGGCTQRESTILMNHMFDFHKNQWIKLKNMNHTHWFHGSYFDPTLCMLYIGGGGESVPLQCQRSVEKYDFVKNKWMKLPDTNYHHSFNPILKMDNPQILYIIGDTHTGKRKKQHGAIESLDIRANKWHYICDLTDILKVHSEFTIL